MNEKIVLAIEAFKQNKEVCVPVSKMGNDNLRTLDIMIDVLENNLDEDDIEEKYGNDDDEFRTANEAFEMMQYPDDIIIEDYLYPLK